ncbi:MAG: HIRAN domain-containing protein [Methanogenium sp.]|jgi:hypothetical protein
MAKSFFIAGVKFRLRNDIDKALRRLKVGDHLELYPEPTNKFDPNAIKIGYDEEISDGVQTIFLGYVPKKFTADLSADLEIGADLECVVEEVNVSAPTYEMFKVIIRDKDEEVNEDM